MSAGQRDWVLAVDGGGSGSRVALVADDVRFEATGGPANVTTDFDGAVDAIKTGLAALAEQAGLAPRKLCRMPAYLGLAGIVDAEDARQLAAALPLQNAVIESDQPATVAGALGDKDGAVAGLGTGSFFGLSRSGALRLAGGWGHRIDDRASGYWLGRQALRHALEAYDGRAGQSALSRALTRRFQSPREIVAFARDVEPAEMASLAHLVTECVEAGDPAAKALLAVGAKHVISALTAIGWSRDLPLCVIGGVAEDYRPALSDHATLIDPAGTTLDGAIALARKIPSQ